MFLRLLIKEIFKMTKRQIEIIKKKIVPILRRNNIKKAGIFGSYATGRQKKNSDIDILVEINDKNFGLLDLVKLKIVLEQMLKKKVDLIEYSTLHPLIKKNALNEEIKII